MRQREGLLHAIRLLDRAEPEHALELAAELRGGQQAGDPARAAQVLLDLVEHCDPPVHLLLRAKLGTMAAEITRWEGVSTSTDFA